MNTQWMLAGRYEGLPVIPVDRVCTDFFPHLTRDKFLRKTADGSIKLPVVRMEDSQKAARGVYLMDLASYLDDRRAKAMRDFNQFHN